MITEKEVKHIAKLARLGLTSTEINKFQKELSSILGYIGKLKEIDVSGVEPASHPLVVKNVMREDKESEKLKAKSEKLLELAPDTKDGYIKVKSVFK